MISWWNRQRALLDFAALSLARRKGKNAAALMVYTLILFLLASALLFSHALRQEASILLENSPEILVQRLLAGRHDTIGDSHVQAIATIRGTGTVQGRLWGYLFDSIAAANYTVMVPPDNAPARGQAVIGPGIAAVRGIAPGDVISLRTHDGTVMAFKVAGLLDSRSALVSADLFLIDQDDFRRLFGMPQGRYTDIAVSVRNPREVRKVAEKIEAALPDTRIITRDDIRRTYESVFDWREGLILLLLLGALLAFAIFAWEKASGLSAEERREIGILKAVGWETGDVIALKTLEGVLISLTAFLLGYGLAWLHVFQWGAPLFEPVLKGWSVLYPDFRPAPYVDELQVAILFFFTVFPYTLAIVVPIWRTATADPDQVMR